MRAKTEEQHEIRNSTAVWALMASTLILTLTFTVFPMSRGLCLGLSKCKSGMNSAEFVSLENYVKLAGSKLFWKVMKNIIVFTLMMVIPSMAVGLGLTVLADREGKGVGFICTAYFYPMIIPMIAIASVRMFIYMVKNGPFGQLLIAMGLKPMNILSGRNTVLPAIVVVYVWKEAEYPVVFFLSGIQSISDEVVEAARIDGAGSRTVFRRITIPPLAPTFLFVSIIAFTNCFKLVDHVVIMTGEASNNASTLLLYYIYQQGFINFNYGVSSVLTVIMLGLLLVMSLPRFISQDKKIHYN